MGQTIGIDLGTTNSCVAYVSNNVPRVIPTEQGFNTMPSAISFLQGGDVLIGSAAKEQIVINPERTIHSIKRLLGRPYSSKFVQGRKQIMPYEIIEDESGMAAVRVGPQTFTIPELQSLILKRLRRYAEIHLGEEIIDAVIAVPAYFSDLQRQAVKEAAQLAGLTVKRLINEPTAAALAHGFNRGFDEKILVYDLGGGTFDVSVLELADNVFEVIATGGDNYLGGTDFDNRIIEHLAEELSNREKIDISDSPEGIEKIRNAAEHAKIELSLLANTEIRIPYIAKKKNRPIHLHHVLTREKLNELTSDLVDRTLEVTRQVLHRQSINVPDINEIVLVGGQTRMPLVTDKLSDFVGRPPRKGVHPEECVALGAALLGDSLEKFDSVTLLDVISVPISIAQPDGSLQTIIEADQRLPCSSAFELSTQQDDQSSIEVDVYQGTSQNPIAADYLGTFIFRPIPSAPAGEVTLNVTFSLDEESMLTILAEESVSGREEKLTLKTLSQPASQPTAAIPEERVSPQAIEARHEQEGHEQSGLKKIVRGLFGKARE